ncbi:methyl-accepting chemotaxis protein [Castellaniella sp.]|uniref:methyl-accepting chemotaxis protein n=1 Tax=Castellaniella sp. TaxID=1955812 RepID=UPI002AFFD2BF|nr:methyl-accepting chemotaxis protein [Castellaniella sp.]
MRNIKIGTRLTMGFGFLILIVLIVSSIGIWRTLQGLKESEVIQERNIINAAILQWVRQVDVNGTRTLAVTRLANEKDKELFEADMKATSAQITELQNKVDSLVQAPEARALFQKVLAARKNYTQSRSTALQQQKDGDTAKASAFFNEQLPLLLSAYKESIEHLYAFQARYEEALFAHRKTQAQSTIAILAILAAISILLGIILAWKIHQSISRPLQKATGLAASIASRDLSLEIKPQGKDEITKLEVALDTMEESLRSAVSEVRSGAVSIASAAGQITAGNLDLSSRTEQQASSLAQTAATMEQITATVRQNADNTQQANTLASAAAQTASSGGSLVAELVGTMGEINSKSQQVADIIGVIDSIAFQTNILALNAAVEAARAGEQGRGFAVVAAEVRALAQRSAGAAKEIKDLIDSSVQATTKGNEQAAHAGDTMQEIVSSINRVTDIMGEINAANHEQTTGIEEINTAITQMDDATRQNASLVEESAAAATSLQAQADNLASLVATFNLGQHSSAAQSAGAARQQRSHTGSQTRSGTGAHQQPSGQAARMPSAPEKVISPAPGRAPRTAQAPAAPASASSRPALRAPGKPAPTTADTQEWTEF